MCGLCEHYDNIQKQHKEASKIFKLLRYAKKIIRKMFGRELPTPYDNL